MTDDALRERVRGYLKGDEDVKSQFLARLTYCQGLHMCLRNMPACTA